MSDMTWEREDAPRWDADKERVFGDVELASVGMTRPRSGAPLADEWWRVTDASGAVVGYGWLDAEWGDAEIRFVVAGDRRGSGIGAFVVERLEREAAGRGLNYIYNSVPGSHPDAAWMTDWLTAHGFESRGGELHRRVRAVRG
jgi:GNAT superfamily N-acetyltransferase